MADFRLIARMPGEREIRWTPAPVPTPDPLAMSDEDLLVNLIAEADAYRRLAQASFHALHDLQAEHDRHLRAHHRLVDEYRRLREQVLREAA